MGWGCYKHEWDAGSENWRKFVVALCNRKLKENPRTFGRDGEVCPKCYLELQQALELDEKRVVQDSRRRAARENVIEHARISLDDLTWKASAKLEKAIQELDALTPDRKEKTDGQV